MQQGCSLRQQPRDTLTHSPRAQSHQLKAHRSKAQNQKPTPTYQSTSLLLWLCLYPLLSSPRVTTFHLIEESLLPPLPHILLLYFQSPQAFT